MSDEALQAGIDRPLALFVHTCELPGFGVLSIELVEDIFQRKARSDPVPGDLISQLRLIEEAFMQSHCFIIEPEISNRDGLRFVAHQLEEAIRSLDGVVWRRETVDEVPLIPGLVASDVPHEDHP